MDMKPPPPEDLIDALQDVIHRSIGESRAAKSVKVHKRTNGGYTKMKELWVDELMVIAATRYCLGRMTYIVSVCCEWLMQVWTKLSKGTRQCILRDVCEAICEGNTGMEMDESEWIKFARFAWAALDETEKADMLRLLVHKRGSDRLVNVLQISDSSWTLLRNQYGT